MLYNFAVCGDSFIKSTLRDEWAGHGVARFLSIFKDSLIVLPVQVGNRSHMSHTYCFKRHMKEHEHIYPYLPLSFSLTKSTIKINHYINKLYWASGSPAWMAGVTVLRSCELLVELCACVSCGQLISLLVSACTSTLYTTHIHTTHTHTYTQHIHTYTQHIHI